MSKYFSTQYPGIRYRKHTTRKFNGKLDRYFFIRYKCNGKTIEEAVGWTSHGMNAQKATKIRSDLIQNIKLGRSPQTLREKREIDKLNRIAEKKLKQQAALEKITFSELGVKYIEWARHNKKSWKTDKQRHHTHLQPALGDKPLNKISPFDLEKLKNKLQGKKICIKTDKPARNLSPATIKHCLVLVRQMFNKAEIWGLYNGPNPVKKIKLPKLNNIRLRFLSYEEADQLLTTLKKKSSQVHDQTLIALHCGLRFGEIANLTLSDIDIIHGIIQIRDPKGESRQAYMTDEVKIILSSRAPKEATDLIFQSTKGTKQVYVSKTFGRTVSELGYNNGIIDRRHKLVFHSLRHTFGSWLAMQGTPLLTIKELLGHKSIEMTMRYAHLIPDQKQAAVKELIKNFSTVRADAKKA